MCTNFDEMDIEPKSERPSPPSKNVGKNDEKEDEELRSKLLLNTVPLDDGSIGYVFTCTRSGPLATWRCHACNFVDTWKNLKRHLDSKWHFDCMSKFQHSRANFSKVENAIQEISKGQPLPPGMEDVITGPCQILKTLENYDQPLIGLEFLLELNILDLKEPRYLCLLCDKRGDPRSILVHLTSQSHYLWYLRKYFKKFFNLIDKLPKSVECRGSVCTVTSHLIAKLEEKYGRLQPTATREDIINSSEQRSILLQKIDSGIHFTETPEDSYLEEMLTIEYVQNTHLLVKKFPLKPKLTNTDERADEYNSKSLFNKSSKMVNRKQLRNRDSSDPVHEESPEVLFVGSSSGTRKHPEGSRPRSRDKSPMSRMRRSSRSPRRRSSRSRSSHRSRTPDYMRRKYPVPPPNRPPPRWSRSRSRSPSFRRHRSRTPFDRHRYRSPHSRRPPSRPPPGYRHRSPEHHHHYRERSPPNGKPSLHPSRSRNRSRSRSPKRSGRENNRERTPPRSSRGAQYPHSKNGSSRPEHRSSSGARRDPPKEKESSEKPDRPGYLKALAELEESMNKDMDKYSETPENHPAYQEEWKKFWCTRFKELQSEGNVDPHTYDFKPEWITFWNGRMKELFKEELTNRQISLKSKYNIKDSDELIPVTPVSEVEKELSSPIDENKKPVVNIKTMWKELTGFEIREEPPRKSPSPWEEDNEDLKENKAAGDSKLKEKVISLLDDACTQPISPEPLSSISDNDSIERNSPPRSRSRSVSPVRSFHSRSRSRSRSRSHSKTRSYSKERLLNMKEEYPFRKPSKKIHFDNPLNIITVLRQLSVLEFQLGSYASHVIKLLSSGLAMEKIKPQSSIDMLTTENVMFLELVKEKLKGQLLAGVVQKAMVKATLFCIKNIEELLVLAPKMKPAAPPPIPTPPPALIYGAGVEVPSIPSQASGLQYGSHVYGGHQVGGHQVGVHQGHQGGNQGGGRNRRFRDRNNQNRRNNHNNSNVNHGNNSDDFPRSQQDQKRLFDDPVKSKPPPMPAPPLPSDEIIIDERLIAVQIAEVLTSQGRTDVSEEELRTLINTVVENLKEEQRNRLSAKEKGVTREPVTTSTLAAAAVTSTNSDEPEITSIPAGFNLNDVSNSTLALLQDAFENASSIKAAATDSIETLPEIEIIQLLRNFKSIPRVKQEKLIEFLRKLEDTDPQRVEELKKYVNVR